MLPDHNKMLAYSYCTRKTDKPFVVEPGKTVETTLDVWCKWNEALATIPGCAAGAECTVPMEYVVNVSGVPVRREWNQNEYGFLDAKMTRPPAKAGGVPGAPASPK